MPSWTTLHPPGQRPWRCGTGSRYRREWGFPWECLTAIGSSSPCVLLVQVAEVRVDLSRDVQMMARFLEIEEGQVQAQIDLGDLHVDLGVSGQVTSAEFISEI